MSLENWIIMPVHNGLAMTQDAVDDCLRQDVGDVRVLVVNNGSTDGTTQYLSSMFPRVTSIHFYPAKGVSRAWNEALKAVLASQEHALVVNNDVRLRPDTYRKLLGDGGGFVTGVGTGDSDGWAGGECSGARRPHPDFSCYLIRQSVWAEVGEFDDRMSIYCSDGDYHLRLHRAGIEANCIDLPFYHIASGTIKMATGADRTEIGDRAAEDRREFREKWGCEMGSPEYYGLFEAVVKE